MKMNIVQKRTKMKQKTKNTITKIIFKLYTYLKGS